MKLTLSVETDDIYVYSGCTLQQIAPANLNGNIISENQSSGSVSELLSKSNSSRIAKYWIEFDILTTVMIATKIWRLMS